MKSKLFLTVTAVLFSLSAFAQTKGTNALSLGITSTTDSYNILSDETKYKTNLFSLGYGNFIKENTKLGIELSYGKTSQHFASTNDHSSKTYGGSLSLQRYYPLVKTLYAYAGGRAGYARGKEVNITSNEIRNYNNNQYTLGAYGGITWFLSKRFAFETSLLSANAYYSETKSEMNYSGVYENGKHTSFNLTTDGFINNLGFKIYLLF